MKPAVYSFNPWNYSDFLRKRGHMLVDVGIFPSEGMPTKIQFVFDTGAYITVLTRLNARRIGLPLTGVYSANLTGFIRDRGYDKAEIVIVPKIEIEKFIVEDVKLYKCQQYRPLDIPHHPDNASSCARRLLLSFFSAMPSLR